MTPPTALVPPHLSSVSGRFREPSQRQSGLQHQLHPDPHPAADLTRPLPSPGPEPAPPAVCRSDASPPAPAPLPHAAACCRSARCRAQSSSPPPAAETCSHASPCLPGNSRSGPARRHWPLQLTSCRGAGGLCGCCVAVWLLCGCANVAAWRPVNDLGPRAWLPVKPYTSAMSWQAAAGLEG